MRLCKHQLWLNGANDYCGWIFIDGVRKSCSVVCRGRAGERNYRAFNDTSKRLELREYSSSWCLFSKSHLNGRYELYKCLLERKSENIA